MKNLFHYRKVRYKDLAKNAAQFHTLFAFGNLMSRSGDSWHSTPQVRPEHDGKALKFAEKDENRRTCG